MSDSKFQLRGFISILLGLAFLVVVASGLVLWLSHAPQTLGIGKGAWKHAHIFVSLLVLTAGLVHMWLNWPVFWSYLWDRAARRLNRKWELAAALAITVLAAGTAALDDHGEDVMRLGSTSLQEIAQKAGKTTDDIVALLKKEGMAVHDPADSLREIAEHNNVPPQALVGVMQRLAPEGMRPGEGRPH
jgi:hypothetical protein